MSEITLERIDRVRGAPVYDHAGEKIGEVEEIFYDHETRRPEWIGIGTGFFGTKRVLVPLEGASISEDGITVRYDKDQVKDSPDIDEEQISPETESALYSYYRLESQSGGAGERGTERAADQAITRSEEELQVGKEQRQAGTARLRKWVETEPVEVDVELKRETARVVRERVDQPTSPDAIGEDEAEVTLRRERPVVEKTAVAKERVGIQKGVETEQETVRDEVRKERVEIEEDDQ